MTITPVSATPGGPGVVALPGTEGWAQAVVVVDALGTVGGTGVGARTIVSRTSFTSTTALKIWDANANALRRQIVNTSDQDLFLRLGANDPTVADWDEKVPAGGTKWSDDGNGMWKGEVRGILAGAIGSGAVRPMELTA
jgi:hypothetical protein